jgi:hypothetical protein
VGDGLAVGAGLEVIAVGAGLAVGARFCAGDGRITGPGPPMHSQPLMDMNVQGG